MLLGIGVLVALALFWEINGEGAEQRNILRKEWGEGSKKKELKLVIPELSTEYNMEISIEERRLTVDEKTEYLELAKKEIKRTFYKAGDESSAVYHNVMPKNSYQNGNVDAVWSFESNDIIAWDGTLEKDIPKKGEKVYAVVHLNCDDIEAVYEFSFAVYPLRGSFEEEIKKDIQQRILSQNEASELVELPHTACGYELIWREEKEPILLKTISFIGLCIGMMVLWKKEKLRDKRKEFQEQMRMDYPDFISKLSLLLGAGMTVSAAFKKIDVGYQKLRKNNNCHSRMLYEELSFTIGEIENGVGEFRAYARFGERCGLWQYRRLTALIIQSQQIGNRKLVEQLNNEAVQAFAERKEMAKKRGEEAGTKLLFPMMIMMFLIMGLVMIPAYLSMQV